MLGVPPPAFSQLKSFPFSLPTILPVRSEQFAERLLAMTEFHEQRSLLHAHVGGLTLRLARVLKQRAGALMRSDLEASRRIGQLLIEMADLRRNDLIRALGLMVEANALSVGGVGNYVRAVELYNEVAAIYELRERPIEQAKAEMGKVFALACQGKHEEAIRAGRWASQIFEAAGQWELLGGVTLNLAIVYSYQGQALKALHLYNKAKSCYERWNEPNESNLARVEQNRAICLQELGRLQESIQASEAALSALERHGQTDEVARVRTNMASTYMMLGRYNEALALLNQARLHFATAGREADVLKVELEISNCLLHLRRFNDVLLRVEYVYKRARQSNLRFDMAQAQLNGARAHVGLNQLEAAQQALGEAKALFEVEGNEEYIARVELEQAMVLQQQAKFASSLAVARRCLQTFTRHHLSVQMAQACLVMTRAALSLGQTEAAHLLAKEALVIGEDSQMPELTHQAHYALAQVHTKRGEIQWALTAFEQAIDELEQLRGNLMVEFRADFVQDKTVIYEEAAKLCLDAGLTRRALAFAERAKSRTLIDMVSAQLDLNLPLGSTEKQPLLDEFANLRTERDRAYQHWEDYRLVGDNGAWVNPNLLETAQKRGVNFPADNSLPPRLLQLEARITRMWHDLMVEKTYRSPQAPFPRDGEQWASLCTNQSTLPADVLLLEYFSIQGQLVAFTATREAVHAYPLAASTAQVEQLLRLFHLNLHAVANQPAGASRLLPNARGVLNQLHELLLAPVDRQIQSRDKLVVVPHGSLHYVPFHALHNGDCYLLEQTQVSYLPGASLLRPPSTAPTAARNAVAFGYSYGGRLPFTTHEANGVAAALGVASGATLCEEQATLAQLRRLAPDSHVLHLATHGCFRGDNPLFSGLALADGWLTTLDIFNLQLKASLVVLSACQTGRSMIGGGDELMGLMRAFLAAGAASLISTLWTVEDSSTATLMDVLYRQLAQGENKGQALRHAQLCFAQADSQSPHAHPYFWSPFLLTGDWGVL